jgi:hypothetical protein
VQVECYQVQHVVRDGKHRPTAFDEYTPPMLEDDRLIGHTHHLENLRQQSECDCCPWCWGSIHLDPGDGRSCLGCES